MAGPWDTPPTPEELGDWSQPPTQMELAQTRLGRPLTLQEVESLSLRPEPGGAPPPPVPETQRGRLQSMALGLESGIPFATRLRKAVKGVDQSVIPEVNQLEDARQREEAWQQHGGLYGLGKGLGIGWTASGIGRIPGVVQGTGTGFLGPTGLAANALRGGAAWGAIEGADTALDQPLAQAPTTIGENAIRNAEFGLALAPLGALASKIPGALKSAAEKNAIRAMGAPGAVGKLVAREGAERVPEVARQMLDEGVPLKSPGDALRAIKDSLGTNYGPAIASLTSQAKQAGARFNLGSVIGDFQSKVPELMKDPQKVPIINAVQDYLTKVAQNRGIWTPDQRLITELAPDEAWQLRQNLDVYLRGVQKNLDPSGTLTKSFFNYVRHLVDNELRRTMSSVGLGEPWAAANSAYHNLSAGQKLAKAGVVNEAVKEAGPGQPLMARLKEMRLPGPAPATKAKVQNTLYRLMSPKSALDPLEAPPWNPGGFAGAVPAPGSTGLPGETFQPAPNFEVWRPPAGQSPVLPQQPSTYAGPERRSMARLQADLDAARREAILRALSKE